jgi:putative PEP-CTERM system TPR-repeat lipoprotein
MTALAMLAERAKQRPEAAQWLEKAAAVDATALPPAMRLASFYLQTGQAAKAVEHLRKVLVVHAAEPAVLEAMGRAQQASGDLAGAIETFGKLASAAPKSPQPQLYLAAVQIQNKNMAAAQASVKKALSLAPDFVPAHLMQADLALAQNKPDDALAVLRALQKAQPKLAAGFLAEGELQMRLGKPAQAIAPYQQAFNLAPQPQVMVKLANALRAAGRASEADAQVATWRKAHPEEPLGLLYTAEQNIVAKQYKAAIGQLESVLAKMPDNVLALNNLAWSYQQEKDQRALATAEKAYQLAGDNPTIMDTLGWILVERNQLDRALPLLQKAVTLSPQAGDIRFHYAAALSKKGDKAQARKELEAALAGPAFASGNEARSMLSQLKN